MKVALGRMARLGLRHLGVADAAGYVTKPIDRAILFETLERLRDDLIPALVFSETDDDDVHSLSGDSALVVPVTADASVTASSTGSRI